MPRGPDATWEGRADGFPLAVPERSGNSHRGKLVSSEGIHRASPPRSARRNRHRVCLLACQTESRRSKGQVSRPPRAPGDSTAARDSRTIRHPPRAAVLPARGGIGSGERPARADPGNLPIHSPGQQRRSHWGWRDGRWCASPKGPPPKFGESGGQVGRPASTAGHRQLTHLERSGR
jgi:hypothetical protein